MNRISRGPSDHVVMDLRTRVFEATAAATAALDEFSPEIRGLAIRQLMVDVEIRAAALSLVQAPAIEPTDFAIPSSEYTYQQVAERFHVSVDAVKKWAGRPDDHPHKLFKTKAGGRTVFTESQIQDFLRRSTSGIERKAS